MSVSDKELADFSDLCYLDLPNVLWDYLMKPDIESIPIKELADYYLSDNNPGKFKYDDIQDQRIISILKECQNGAYSNYEIISYDNKTISDDLKALAKTLTDIGNEYNQVDITLSSKIKIG